MSQNLGITQTTGLQNVSIQASADHPYLYEEVTVASPQVLNAGTVLYAVGGKGTKWNDAGDVIGVLLHPVDAELGDVKGIAAFGGPFNQNALDATTTPVALGVLAGNRLVQVVKEY